MYFDFIKSKCLSVLIWGILRSWFGKVLFSYIESISDIVEVSNVDCFQKTNILVLSLIQVDFNWFLLFGRLRLDNWLEKSLDFSQINLKRKNLRAIQVSIIFVVFRYWWSGIKFWIKTQYKILHRFCITVKTNLLFLLFKLGEFLLNPV